MARASDGTGGSSAVFVVTLTAVALAIVGFLAWQAAGAVEPRTDTAAPAGSDAGDGTGDPANTPIGDPADGGDSGDDGAGGDGGASGEAAHPPLPPVSGTGARVVYSLGEQRVWLVGTDGATDGTDGGASDGGGGETVVHSHPVHPSPVRPEPGEYEVTWRAEATTGSDGVPITNVVVFTSVGDAVVGFSTAEDGSIPDPDGPERTGGIRQSAEDGEIMWSVATIGFPVVVVP
ncbi:hypothetical protein FNQ90_20600 [Streptomyces alkaliphilus]|uniref:L,D-transpeptidase n=1 Tax=Streptomyces alkaliphilus TaxID=1472722 RepID=A0A7W3Y3G7_9ACTN|nr:hypothetical protein [Streptomyces alkaliphilus]MBB0246446.1 hypothetical protein [Streptomyces alkaliphilus]